MKQQTFEHFICSYYRKNWTNFYTITNTKTWRWTSKWRDWDENPDKTAKLQLIIDCFYEKKKKKCWKFTKKLMIIDLLGIYWKNLKFMKI